jgi:hypothetical protein
MPEQGGIFAGDFGDEVASGCYEFFLLVHAGDEGEGLLLIPAQSELHPRHDHADGQKKDNN